ncbi:hypothetical protein [Bacillus sp. BP-3]|uniref:hypothetical protein n=1 Tax=Bacillus sp. BP-3 TaxID=3022773 RepID=UPI00232E6044|nr:hypothetical protein [Bacillus sp. BP-3]
MPTKAQQNLLDEKLYQSLIEEGSYSPKITYEMANKFHISSMARKRNITERIVTFL